MKTPFCEIPSTYLRVSSTMAAALMGGNKEKVASYGILQLQKLMTEVALHKYSYKKVFSKYAANLQENAL